MGYGLSLRPFSHIVYGNKEETKISSNGGKEPMISIAHMSNGIGDKIEEGKTGGYFETDAKN